MAYQLLDLELDELSLVTEPANQFASVLFTKAHHRQEDGLAKARHDFARGITEHKKVVADYYAEFPHDRGTAMNEDLIAKSLAGDVTKGHVTVLKADIKQLAKARARELWLARGAPPGTQAAIMDEIWRSPLSGMGEPSPDDPSLQQLHDLAAESHEVAKAHTDLIVERDSAAVALVALVEKTARDHPDWSRLKALDFAYRTDPGQALRAKHNAAAQRLQEMTP